MKGIAGKEDIQFKSSGTTKQTFTRTDASSRTLTLEQIDGAHIQFRTLAKSIDDLVDGGYDVAIKPQYIFGGGTNTVGHTVPNAADDTFVLRDTDETISGDKVMSGANTHSGANTFSGVTTFTGTRKGDMGADVASEATLFDANGFPTDGNYFNITGTTGITAITGSGQVGTVIHLHFDGALTLTHHATNLVLPGLTSITTYAGMELTFEEYSTDDWRLIGGSIIPHDHSKAALGGSIAYRGACAYNVANQNINDSTNTILSWDSEEYDTDSIHDNAANNDRLTVPVGVTRVKMSFSVVFDSNATGYRSAWIAWSGGANVANVNGPPTNGVSTTLGMHTQMLSVVAGQYFTGVVYQTSGGVLAIIGSATGARLEMEIIQ